MEGRGYVPDLLVRVWDSSAQPPRYIDTLHDVKTLHAQRNPAATSAYSNNMSVDKKADGVHADVESKLRRADAQFFRTPPGADGPLAGRLHAYGRVSGLVFGAVGEASAPVKALVDSISSTAARSHAERRGRTHMPSAVAEAKTYGRDRIAMANLIGMAELLLDRSDVVTLPGYRRSAHAAHKKSHSADWNAAFDHMRRASEHSARSRAARGSYFFTRARFP